MAIVFFKLLFFLAFADPTWIQDPVFPPNTFKGGTVVATLRVDAGAVTKVEILVGEEPFEASARVALSSWRFPREHQDANIPVIVHFRNPNLYHAGAAWEQMKLPVKHGRGPVPPYPTRISAPAYPPNVVGQGSVVVRLDVNPQGGVSGAHPVMELGALTKPCIDAMSQWQFEPALDRNQRPTASSVYAVCVFRFPVTVKPRPK